MSLVIDKLSRRFADFAALDDIRLHLAPGEFLALLGPSGSGKTTLLRILAGLDYPDEGTVRQGDRDFLAAGARARNVGLVFQHYALFRHLTVRENVAFGLRVRPRRARPSRAEIRARVERLLKRVQLEDFGARYPTQLSGGQRQRVALARALAVEPELLLLDEPFGALDAQVRVALRRWLRELHEELGLTTVFVTHDQEEALELADRIAVMNRGRIEQVGTPQAVYQDPASPFVCEFIGRNNRIPLRRTGDGWASGDWPLAVDPWGGRHQRAVAYVRPEHLALAVPEGQPAWNARLRHAYPAGGVTHLDLHVAGIDLSLEADVSSEGIARRDWRPGTDVRVAPQQLVAFPIEDDSGSAVVRDRWTWRPPDRC